MNRLTAVDSFKVRGAPVRLPFFLAAAVTVVALLTACGGDQPTSVSKEISAADGGTVSLGGDITLRIPAGALSEDAAVTITRASENNPSPGELEAATSIGHAFEIDLAGAELTRPVTLTIAYDPNLLPDDMPGEAAFLAYYDEARGEWVPVYGTVDLDRHVVTVETSHLSWWGPVTWLWDKVTQKIEQAVESLFAFIGFPEAELPDCSGLPPVHMSLEFNDILLPCIEATGNDGEARLKVVNNRAYSVLMSYPPSVKLEEAAEIGSLSDGIGELLHEAGLLGRGDSYVPAAGEAQFFLQFLDAGEEQISSSSAREMIGIDMLLIWLGALGIDILEYAPEVLDGVDCIIMAVTADAEPTMTEIWNVARECALAVAKPLLGSVFGVLVAFIKTAVLTIPALAELAIDDFINDGQGVVTITYSPPQVTPPEEEPPPPPPPEPPPGPQPEPPSPPPPEPPLALESSTGDPLGDWGCAAWVGPLGGLPVWESAASGPDMFDITHAALRFLPDAGLLELELDVRAAVAPSDQFQDWAWSISIDDSVYYAKVANTYSGEFQATVSRTYSPYPGSLYTTKPTKVLLRDFEVSGSRLRMRLDVAPSLLDMARSLTWVAVTSGPGAAEGDITCYDQAPNDAPLILEY